jgi:hypothetical protein
MWLQLHRNHLQNAVLNTRRIQERRNCTLIFSFVKQTQCDIFQDFCNLKTILSKLPYLVFQRRPKCSQGFIYFLLFKTNDPDFSKTSENIPNVSECCFLVLIEAETVRDESWIILRSKDSRSSSLCSSRCNTSLYYTATPYRAVSPRDRSEQELLRVSEKWLLPNNIFLIRRSFSNALTSSFVLPLIW